jgi:hypothetical protein
MHYFHGVILPKKIDIKDEDEISDVVAEFMHDYDENNDEECDCHGYNLNCENCEGTGRISNRDGKWDWYHIGGAWNGAISGKEVAIYGKEEIEGNVIKISDFLKLVDEGKTYLPSSFIDPEGDWYEPVELMDWVTLSPALPIEDRRRKILEKYKSYYIVGIDCHV